LIKEAVVIKIIQELDCRLEKDLRTSLGN